MIRDNGLDHVLSEEAGDAGVVPALGSRIVQAVPTDLELVPALDPLRAHLDDRHALGATPTRIHGAILSNWEADDHPELLNGMTKSPAVVGLKELHDVVFGGTAIAAPRLARSTSGTTS
jgi:hypothetical protein